MEIHKRYPNFINFMKSLQESHGLDVANEWLCKTMIFTGFYRVDNRGEIIELKKDIDKTT
jgi:hypothetical protein